MELERNFGFLALIGGALLMAWTAELFWQTLSRELRSTESVVLKALDILFCLMHLAIAVSLMFVGAYVSFR